MALGVCTLRSVKPWTLGRWYPRCGDLVIGNSGHNITTEDETVIAAAGHLLRSRGHPELPQTKSCHRHKLIKPLLCI